MTKEELRQRLIELIEHCSCRYSPPCTGECAECINVDMRDRQIEYIADHLIANGVTIRERGEWEMQKYPLTQCSSCKILRDCEHEKGWNFCPHCGADMRGVKDE